MLLVMRLRKPVLLLGAVFGDRVKELVLLLGVVVGYEGKGAGVVVRDCS